MATLRNPTKFSLYSVALGRSLEAGEIATDVPDAIAEEACRSGVFELGVLAVVDESPADADEEEEKPKRGPGRPRSVRGAVEVEETIDDERETR